jgi:hypothetical protein
MRFPDYSGYTPGIAPSTTAVVTGNTLPWAKVVFWIIELIRGTGGSPNLDASYVNRVKFKVGGSLAWDVPLAHLRAIQESCLESQAANATTGYTLIVPAINKDAILLGKDPDSYQFEPGEPQLEIDFGAFTAGTDAGTDKIRVGWIRSDVPASAYARCVASALNIAASQSNQAKPLSYRGLLRGFGLNNTGLTRGRLMVNGVKYWESDTVIGAGVSQVDSPLSVTNPVFTRFRPAYPVMGGGPAELVIDTGSGWAGIGNEISPLIDVPLA